MDFDVALSQTIWGIELFEQGERKGKLKGEAALLQRLLERRFGKLPDWAMERVQQADEAQLETWSLRVLECDDLESIFI